MHHVHRLLLHSAARVLFGLGLLAALLAIVGPLDFGAYSGCLAAASIFGAASCLGFDRVMLIADPGECRALRGICLLVALALGVAAGATCWLVSSKFAARDLGPASVDVTAQWMIAVNGFLQLMGTAAILCNSQMLIRNGRFNTANLCLSLPSMIVLGAQVISVRMIGSSVSALAVGAIAGWFLILVVVFLGGMRADAMPTVPVKPVLQRWWKPAMIRMGTGIFSNARTQLSYLVIFVSTPVGAELLAAVRLFDTGGSALSGVLERSWGTVLASIGCTESAETFGVKSDSLIEDFARWIRNLAVVCVPAVGIAAFAGRHILSDRWCFIVDIAPPLLIATAIAAQVAWLERLFEYQRRFKAGFWAEVFIMVISLGASAAVLPMTTSLVAGAWVFGVVYASAMLVRGYASMRRGVSRTTSRATLLTVASVALSAGIVVWIAQVLP
jgi:O-antigen/teichoic acid export membrane protein